MKESSLRESQRPHGRREEWYSRSFAILSFCKVNDICFRTRPFVFVDPVSINQIQGWISLYIEARRQGAFGISVDFANFNFLFGLIMEMNGNVLPNWFERLTMRAPGGIKDNTVCVQENVRAYRCVLVRQSHCAVLVQQQEIEFYLKGNDTYIDESVFQKILTTKHFHPKFVIQNLSTLIARATACAFLLLSDASCLMRRCHYSGRLPSSKVKGRFDETWRIATTMVLLGGTQRRSRNNVVGVAGPIDTIFATTRAKEKPRCKLRPKWQSQNYVTRLGIQSYGILVSNVVQFGTVTDWDNGG